MSSLFDMAPQERETAANMHNLNKKLIAAIYAAAKAQNITQSEIAKRIETNKSSVSRLLQGRGNPTFRTVSEICAALNLSPDLVFSEHGPGSNTERFVKGGLGHGSTTFQPKNANNKAMSMSESEPKTAQYV